MRPNLEHIKQSVLSELDKKQTETIQLLMGSMKIEGELAFHLWLSYRTGWEDCMKVIFNQINAELNEKADT